MDILDFFENMGLGISIIIVVAAVLFLIMVAGYILPVLLTQLFGIFIIILSICAVGVVIYFIGKFAKDLIRK